MHIQLRQRYELNQILAEANAKLQQQIMGGISDHQPNGSSIPTNTTSNNCSSHTTDFNHNSSAINLSGVATSNMILASGILRRSNEDQLPAVVANNNNQSNSNYNIAASNNNSITSARGNGLDSHRSETSNPPLHGILKNSNANSIVIDSATNISNNGVVLSGRSEEVAPSNRVFRKKNFPQQPLPSLPQQQKQQSPSETQSLPQLHQSLAYMVSPTLHHSSSGNSNGPSSLQAMARSAAAMLALQQQQHHHASQYHQHHHHLQQEQEQQQQQQFAGSFDFYLWFFSLFVLLCIPVPCLFIDSDSGNVNRQANLSLTADDIGRSLEMFSFRQNNWERIDIVDFDHTKRFYKVRYPNQAIQWLDLSKKPVRSLLDEVYTS